MQKCAHLVELEKCCRTHIFLQNFVLIQPRTSPLKICKIFQNLPILLPLPPNPNPLISSAQVLTSGPVSPAVLSEAVALCQGAGVALDRLVRSSLATRYAAIGRRHDGRSAKFRQNVARFRLYRHRSLQVITRFAA